MGLVSGVCILHSPNALRVRVARPTSQIFMGGKAPRRNDQAFKSFAKEPVGFFRGRKPLWWAWWLVRVGALLGVLIGFVFLLNNFYKYDNTCSWCKYLTCLVSASLTTPKSLSLADRDALQNVSNWCDVGNLASQITNTTHSSKRDLFSSLAPADLSHFL